MPQWTGRWEHGRTYVDGGGQEVFLLEKQRGGKRYNIPLRVPSESEALAEWRLFDRDAEAYVQDQIRLGHLSRTNAARTARLQAPAPEPEGVSVTTATIQGVLDHLRALGRNEAHVLGIRRYLADWGDILGGRPLQTISPAELERYLDNWPFKERAKSRRYKIVALKCFASFYIRQKHLLRSHQNPTAELVVRRPKAKDPEIYGIEEVQQHYLNVSLQCVRDVLVLRAKGGMHGSEIDRIARKVGTKVEPIKNHPVLAALLSYPHKRGETHRQFIDTQMLEAVKRLQERGRAPTKETVLHEMKSAAVRLSKKLGRPVSHLHPSKLRHSFLSWGTEMGEKVTRTGMGMSVQDMADIANHSRETSRKHYNRAPAAYCKLPLKLKHPDDPSNASLKPGTVHRLPATV